MTKVLTLASSKGGCCKTTTCICIAHEAALRGLKVGLLDVDPNGGLANWHKLTDSVMPCIADHNPEDLLSNIKRLKDGVDLVIIDTPGFGNQISTFAMGLSNAVIVPFSPSGFDAKEARKTAKTIQTTAAMAQREIEASLLLARYEHGSKVAKFAEEQAQNFGLPTLKSKIRRSVALAEISFGAPMPRNGQSAIDISALFDELEKCGYVPEKSAFSEEE